MVEEIFLFDSTFRGGGYYNTLDNLTLCIKDSNLTILTVDDFTQDYFWTSVIEPEHFGNWTIDWTDNTSGKIRYLYQGIFTDPFLLHHWMYYMLQSWMWQFGGYQKHPLSAEQIKNAPFNLKYLLIQKL